ncbi:MAG TPA: cytochrome D1 domain-containing protein [Thermoanaerobaculia bacterium]|jgi:YVTN family beta-propeller protein|nr:cytochrome D1 domain-containing protein [Thermoanaerobaculia bacterium]
MMQLTSGSFACRSGCFLAMLAMFASFAMAGPARAADPAPAGDQKIVQDGISVEMKVEPVNGKPGPVVEGQEVRVRLKITDKLTGSPLTGLYPGGWMDRARARKGPGQEIPVDCKKKVESFVGDSMLSRPEIDLNTYYVLALNEDASISVVDPLFGYGNSKLLTMIFLKSPGEDWVLSADGERLFVSMPDSGSVALVETASWKVQGEIAAGPHPRRLALQPDGQYLWVATDTGVSVLNTHTQRKVADLATGQGGHDLTFSDDSRFAFVTNETDGTVSVLDTGKLAKLRDVPVGVRPVSLSWSTQAKAVYVTTAGDGTIVAVDARNPKPVARMASTPGLGQIRFAPGGRLAFAVHTVANTVLIIDAASNRIIQTADVEKEPDQLAFSDELAYIRHRGSDTVLMIPLKTVGEPGKPVAVIDFPGGQHPPGQMTRPTPAAGIVQAPGASAVLVANPQDQVIYFYKEGMAAPMGHFNNYGKQPRAALVVDRSLREVQPGVYETTATMAGAGDYELALFVDSPKLVQCFPVKIATDPVLAAARKPVLGVEPVGDTTNVAVGTDVAVRFKLTDPGSGAPRTGLKDVRMLTFLAPGRWQQRQWAAEVGQGVYEVKFKPPQEGIYYVFVEVASAGLSFQKSPYMVLSAETQNSPASQGGAR